MLDRANLDPEHLIGIEPVRIRRMTAEKLAVNAVMAGCLPDHFPLVCESFSAMLKEPFLLHGATASTGGCAVLVVINGPVREQLGMCGTFNVLGSSDRATTVIGRAIRLILCNLLDARPGDLDRSTLGHPGKFSYCIAENETTEWQPLHIQKGYSQETSTVTVFAGEAPNQFQNHTAQKAESILLTLADRMAALGTFNINGHSEMAVVLCPEHYQTCQSQGWDKKKIQEFLQKHAFRTRAELIRGGILEEEVQPEDEKTKIYAVESPDDILLVVGGGDAGRFSACIPGWGSLHYCRSVTKPLNQATCDT